MQFDGMREADVMINGRPLTFAQSMTLRVAVGSFLISLSGHEGAAALGNLAANYALRLREIEELMMTEAEEKPHSVEKPDAL